MTTDVLLDQQNEDELKTSIMESTWKVIDGLVQPEQYLASINEQKEKHKQLDSVLTDIISIIDIELNSNPKCSLSSNDNGQNMTSKKDKFYSLINSLKPIIGDDLLKERLEIETLENLKLIAKKELFNQKYIKIKTRLFYKQQKFNLLREEAEGYTRLITELNQTNLNSKILEIIQSLIGCFNLDPNRVLDIILESFENQPLMYKTFIGLLKHYKAEDETICQIIGFKFQSLHQQQLQQTQAKSGGKGESGDTIPQNADHINMDSLYTVTSYLLKYNMIDLDLLMSHLYPNEQQIQQLYKEEFEAARQYAKKLTVVNLSDTSGLPSTSTPNQLEMQQAEDKQKINELLQHCAQLNKLDNQKVYLIKGLVKIGDYRTALKLIEKLPQWYLAIYSDVSLSICRSIDQNAIDLMYRKFNSLSKYLKDKYSNSQAKSSKYFENVFDKPVVDDINNNSSKTNGIDDVEMEDDASQAKLSAEEADEMLGSFIELILPILSALGPGVSYDAVLFTKLVRICVSFLEVKKFSQSVLSSSANSNDLASHQSNDSENLPTTSSQSVHSPAQILKTLNKNEAAFYNQIYTILNEILLPSLSMISANPCLAIELWNLLKLFPYEMRYNLYNNWRLNTYKHFPQLIRAKAECQEKIKYLLKRLTKENVKIHGRQIGKLSHNNPIIVCDYILTQIQRFDNFIQPVVESLKFMTPLSYDVLSYCIIIAISDADKEKMKHDSTNLSSWLQSIAEFCALTFKKYPIELIAMIQYVINQLKNKKSYDLLILQEIVQKMTGIEVLSEVSDLQLEALAGGDLLRQEAGYFNPIRNIKKCANRLKEALADHGLILPLCILLSQLRDYIVYADQAEREKELLGQTEKRHLKLTGCLFDQCQDSLVQFSQFLSSSLSTEEYIQIFPKIDELVNEYHVSPDVAFFLCRPMYSHHIQSKYEELRKIDRNVKTEKPSKTQRYLESIEYVMQPVIGLATTLHPPKIWEDMSPLFYTTFWTLSMSDCFVPSSAYEKQKASLKQKLNALDDNQELTSTKKKKEKEKIMIMLDKLSEEEKAQKDHVQHVKARFEKEKDHWFPQKKSTKNETITVFLQYCIFSRCLFTQIDAYYCSKFIQTIHNLKTPNFSTIICYDRIFSDISNSIASLTDNEARRYGRFLLGLLETVMSWHADQQTFENECGQHPGFLTVFRNAQISPVNKQEQLDYENFRHVCHKWHYKLTKSFIVCLESKEYLQMRNSLIILTKILPHYPKLTGFCTALEKRVDTIKQVEKDKRQDIATLASSYLGQLKQRKSHMIDEAKFHIKDQVAENAKTTTRRSEPAGRTMNPYASDKAKQQSNKSHSTMSGNLSFNPMIIKDSITNGSSSSSKSSSSNQTNSHSTSQSAQNKTPEANSSSSASKTNSSSSQSNNSNSQTNKNGLNTSSSNNKENLGTDTKVSNSSTTTTTTNGTTNTSTRVVITSSSSPPSSKQTNDKHDKDESKSNTTSQNSSVNGSKKRPASDIHSPNSSQPAQTPQSPNKNGNSQRNDYSPTSSISSDDLPASPRHLQNSQENFQQNGANNNHSRSSSPTSKANSNSYYIYNENQRSGSSSSDKAKRSKTDDAPAANGNSSSKSHSTTSNTNNNNNSNNNEHSSSSSSKRKSSRERDRERERDRDRDREKDRERDKDKKEHRKREHSNEVGEVQHKRSKSDEAKKKSSSSSSQPSSSATNSSSSSNLNPSNSSSSLQSSNKTSSSSSTNRTSSKKHDSSSSYKDDYSTMNNSSQNSQSQVSISNSNSSGNSKHRSGGDDRRSSHDKNSYYNKDKK